MTDGRAAATASTSPAARATAAGIGPSGGAPREHSLAFGQAPMHTLGTMEARRLSEQKQSVLLVAITPVSANGLQAVDEEVGPRPRHLLWKAVQRLGQVVNVAGALTPQEPLSEKDDRMLGCRQK